MVESTYSTKYELELAARAAGTVTSLQSGGRVCECAEVLTPASAACVSRINRMIPRDRHQHCLLETTVHIFRGYTI